MGNSCCTKRKDLGKVTDTKLLNEKKTLIRSRCGNASFGLTYIGSTVIMIIVIASGGTATLAISAVVTGVGAIYYIYETIVQTNEITQINQELNRRRTAEVSVIDIGKFVITKQKTSNISKKSE